MPKSKTVQHNEKALVCLCGECAHWEIVSKSSHAFGTEIPVALRCMSCTKEFPIHINVPASDHLAFVGPEVVKTA